MITVSICVCTRKRPIGIINLLKSIELLQLPSDVNIKVIVVENDLKANTKELIQNYAEESKLNISYFLEQEQGISFARNKCVKEAGDVDFCCFVDDDQQVKSDWIYELIKCQKEFEADGVWGVNPPVFEEEVGLEVEKFHQPEIYDYGTEVKQAYTNCLLIKKKWLDRIDGPFDSRLNFTGGEDSFLTSSLIKMGCKIRFTPFAVAYEIVPRERTTLKYFRKRTVRTINTKYIVKSFLNKDLNKFSILPGMLLRLGKGVLISVPLILFGKSKKFDGILKISSAMGGLQFIFGKHNKFYK